MNTASDSASIALGPEQGRQASGSSIPTDRLNTAELDALLERRIEAARIAMTVAESAEARRTSFEDMRELINQRSQQQKDRMARAQGLPR